MIAQPNYRSLLVFLTLRPCNVFFQLQSRCFWLFFTDAGDGMWTYGPPSRCVMENTRPDSHCANPNFRDVTVGSGQAVENALVSPVLGDGAYGDNMCDGWRITTTGRRQVTIFLPIFTFPQ